MRYSTISASFRFTLGLILVGGILATGVMAAPAGGLCKQSTRSIMLPVGRSLMLHFDRMKRVEIIEPELVEAVVASLSDLSLYGKEAGETTVYVWDRVGIHQIEVTITAPAPAEKLVENLKRVLGPKFSYTVTGDNLVVVEGTVSAEEAERAHTIMSAASTADVQIVDLVETEGGAQSAATAVAQGLQRVLGDQLQYVVWSDNTVLVQGSVGSQAELERIRKVVEAASSPQVQVVNVVEFAESRGTPPIADISRAVGENFQVWQIQGRTVGVSGIVSSKAELDRLDQILGVFDDQARIVNLVQVVEPRMDVNEATSVLQAALGDRVTVQPLGGQALLIQGTVPTEEARTRLQEIIAQVPVGYQVIETLRISLPDKRQVLVHVRVIDINKGALKRHGVNWGQLEFTEDTVRFVDQPWLVQTEGDVDNVFDFGAQIEALTSKNYAQVLSEPNLLVDDGGEAEIQVGGEIPVPISQPGGGGISTVTVEWKPFGVLLVIQPTILDDGEKINLRLAPEVSSLDFGNAVTLGGFVIPALRQRRASTVVTMPNGATLVIGGLLQTDDVNTIRAIPLLSKIPIIGELFKRREKQRTESELLISVTPEIVQELE